MQLRRNLYSLNASERGQLVTAFLGLKQSGIYDEFVRLHQRAMSVATPWQAEQLDPMTRNAAHRGPAFLPWHREYLLRFERALQQIVPGITLPYWDWATDAALPDFKQAEIWGSDLLGGDGDPQDNYAIKDGPFAGAMWPIPQNLDGPVLRRRFGVYEVVDDDGNIRLQNLQISGQTELDSALAEGVYDAASYNTTANGFRRTVEGWNPPPTGTLTGSRMHNIVHLWVGGAWVVNDSGSLSTHVGSMLPGTSPNDPVFFLHHCFVDKIWADWQDLQQANNPAGYPHYEPLRDGPAGHNFFDNMYFSGPAASPASVNHFRSLGYEYEPKSPDAPIDLRMRRTTAAAVPIVSPFQ